MLALIQKANWTGVMCGAQGEKVGIRRAEYINSSRIREFFKTNFVCSPIAPNCAFSFYFLGTTFVKV